MKILMTGATGLIGQEIGKMLVRQGHQVIVVSRDAKKAKPILSFPCTIIEANLKNGILPSDQIQGVEIIYHLAGENVGSKRWSAKQKAEILNSRVLTTQNLVQSFSKVQTLKSIFTASAIGVYGDRKDEILCEKSLPGTGFLAEVCLAWEESFHKSVQELSHKNIRTIIFRTSIVLSPFGGALEKIKTPFLYGAGSGLGDGQQWMSWIHVQDLVRLYVKAIDDENMSGILNAVAPEPERNIDFSRKIANILKTNLLPMVPQFMLKAILGEMSAIVFDSQYVKSEVIASHEFLFPNLISALHDCLQYHEGHDFYFYAEQYIPKKRSEVFPFFATAENLEKITPEQLHFQILNKSSVEVQEGTLIDYRIRIHGVPVRWKTQILNWTPDEKFVDTQLKGPYQRWHHTHSFYDLGNGTLMTDLVRYKVPFGRLGYLFTGILIRKEIKSIFDYRRKVVSEKFD